MKNIGTKKEKGLRRLARLVASLAAAIAAYDVWCLATGHAKQGLYLLPVVLAAFIAIILNIVHHLELPPEERARRLAELHKDSYLHPDNHPKGRIDAPDGTSD